MYFNNSMIFKIILYYNGIKYLQFNVYSKQPKKSRLENANTRIHDLKCNIRDKTEDKIQLLLLWSRSTVNIH